jgi:hypothetical protein
VDVQTVERGAGRLTQSAGRIAIVLQCGACGERAGQFLSPPVPPFASWDFKLRTMARPVLEYVARKAPPLTPIIRGFLDGGYTALVCDGAELAPFFTCERCRAKQLPALPAVDS